MYFCVLPRILKILEFEASEGTFCACAGVVAMETAVRACAVVDLASFPGSVCGCYTRPVGVRRNRVKPRVHTASGC